MTLTIATMAYNTFPGMLEAVGSQLQTSEPYSFIFLDNGSDVPLDQFVFKDLKPYWEQHCKEGPTYIRKSKNVGVTLGWQQVIEHCESDIIALFHNDLRVDDAEWGSKVMTLFDDDCLMSLATFFGCPGVQADGWRGGLFPYFPAGWSNMVDAGTHGERITDPRAIAVPDSFSLIIRWQMLEEVGGLDSRFVPDHFYDYDMALKFLASGYHNMVVPIKCEHLGSRSRDIPQYATWVRQATGGINDSELMEKNLNLLTQIWGSCFPLYVERDFSFSKTDPMTGKVADQDILGYEWNQRERAA